MNKPRKNTMREKAWRLMRSMGSYTLGEIATLAEADVENIRHYHLCLVAAGYARQTGTKRQEGRGGVDKVFRLVKNTGPKPPVQKELRFLFDQNTGDYWAEDPEKVAEAIITPPSPSYLKRGCPKDGGVTSGGITGKIKFHIRPGSVLDVAEKKGVKAAKQMMTHPAHPPLGKGRRQEGSNVD